ncbi:MAG: T9SS type A sorting domain-containing protein, partial [Muribaculaceae bacterium]|nr:T9SS type A sorting domain-containing protein [Muribaculaceae bacterium]
RIAYSGKMLAGKDAPSVSYNIILVDSSDNEVHRSTSEEINYTDHEWAKVTAGDYRYAVEAVYENGKTSARTLSDVLNKSFTASISEVGNDDCDIILNGDILIIPEGISSVTITTTAGHTIFSDKEIKNIDTSDWAKGIYIVTFVSNDKTTSHKFILK